MYSTPYTTEQDLENSLSEPGEQTRAVVAALDGDIAVLGAGGKMGPTMSRMLKKAAPKKRVYAVSRFTDKAVKARLDDAGVDTIEADLLDENAYASLPPVENVYYLVGMKFGTASNQPLTWAMNTFVPALAARYYRKARIVALSTGNVYPLVNINSGGAIEHTAPDPVGEYAQSCLGRERILEYFSQTNGTPMTLIRLNYANEPRYGIIVDLTLKILSDQPIDLGMGYANLIYQRDANDYIIRAITSATSPSVVLNVTGPKTVRIRDLAEQIGERIGTKPILVSKEAPSALLSDASLCLRLFGEQLTPLEQMVAMIVDWVASGKKTLNKPTKYEIRNGKF